ncbi:MAG: hypothetical protein ACK41T_05720 [Pseudobdellovibrio sp.]
MSFTLIKKILYILILSLSIEVFSLPDTLSKNEEIEISRSVASAEKQKDETEKKNSVEDIFIWKMSDELKLTAKEEKKFSDIHKSLNKKKMQLQSDLQKYSYALKTNPNIGKNEIELTIKKYRSTLSQLNNISLQEVDKMKNLLGANKFLQYLAIKQDITLKLKSLVIGQNDEQEKQKEKSKISLPPPKVIEEK